MYFEALPQSARDAVNRVLEAETLISTGRPEPYNAFVLKNSRSTAISASGRVMAGWESVCGATETVARGSTGETNRMLKELAWGWSETMFYVVFDTSVRIQKEDGTENAFHWVITMVFVRVDQEWKLVHRQNTRA